MTDTALIDVEKRKIFHLNRIIRKSETTASDAKWAALMRNHLETVEAYHRLGGLEFMGHNKPWKRALKRKSELLRKDMHDDGYAFGKRTRRRTRRDHGQ